MIEAISKIYRISPIRWSIKLGIMLMGVKIVGDYYFYWTLTLGIKNTIPRHTQFWVYQHPYNPPMMGPYPWNDSMKHIEDKRKIFELEQRMFEISFKRVMFVQRMYKNIPERENPNDIDHYLRYAELERITETLYARALRKMTNSGAVIPDGINQRIRELSQWKFNDKLISPEL